jgi:hypothetical protein
MKRSISVMLFMIMLTTLCGCSKDKATSPKPQESKPPISASTTSVNNDGSSNPESPPIPKEIMLFKKADKTKYLLTNGINIDYKNTSISTKNGEATVRCLQISGLKDKSIEENLNKSIQDNLEIEVRNYALKKDLKKEQLNNLYCVVQLNANNLLSISLRDFYSEPVYGFLYRLTDGQRLHLKDIFTKGTDYVSLLNRKVIESIIGEAKPNNYAFDGVIDYEEYLKAPFSTINPDQNFALSNSTLYIVFLEGEGGFVRRISIPIALASIDDYIDVTDRYSGTERKTQLYTNLIIRHNNNFITSIGNVIKRSNGNIWPTSYEISGLRNDVFEKTINTTLKTEVDEALKEKCLDSLVKDKTQNSVEDFVAIIRSGVLFNNYGVLCISRTVIGPNYMPNKDLDKLYSVYSFDLIKKRLLDTKVILSDYIIKNNVTEDIFTNLVKENLKKELTNINAKNIEELCSKINYSLIKERSFVYFSENDTTEIHVYLKQDSINGLPSNIDCRFPLSSISNGVPEDFFGW